MALSDIKDLLSAIWGVTRDRIPVLSNGKIPVEVSSLNVTMGNASLEIANDVGNPVPINDAGGSITVDGAFWQVTQPVSAVSLPLPSGAATASNQSTSNASLASINTKIPPLGQAVADASTPVVLPATQITALTPNFGTQITDAAMPTGGGGILGWLSAIFRTLSNGTGFASTATIQRPSGATAYTANDVYGSIIQLSNVGPSGGNIFINNVKIMFNTSTPPSGMTSLVIYLYSASPPSAIADNLVFNGASADRDFHLTEDGIILSIATMRGGGSFFAMASNINRQIKLAANSTSLWAYVVTPSAFTPTSSAETGTITINSFVA